MPQCPRFAFLAVLVSVMPCHAGATSVLVTSTPDRGIQPQAVVDARGVIHLVYFRGEPAAGDLFYVHGSAAKFSEPVRVNSQPGSAVAVGSIRGGQIALGKGGRVHVVWNGSSKVKSKSGSPMLYARLNDAGTAFEEQRNLMQGSAILDGGGTVAADADGNVYVAWHALPLEAGKGEDNRTVLVAVSRDEGKTFAKETPAWSETTGACGCCAMRGFADAKASLYFLYRSAKGGDNRDIYLLASTDRGKSFAGTKLHEWKISGCPMSSMAFAEGPGGIVAAWDTLGQIYHATIKPGTTSFGKPEPAPGPGKERKHPALAIHPKGDMILVWTEGTGWMKGGALAYQVFDATGRAQGDVQRLARGVPVWGLPTAVATKDGFLVIH